MKKLTYLAISILSISLISSCSWLKGGDKSGNSDPTVTVYSDVTQKRSDNSPLVASKNGVSDDYLRWIDESMEILSSDISAQHREHNINPGSVIIYVLHTCVPSPESHTPSFLIRADSYDGTVYDQDPRPGIGKIYAAEYVIPSGGGLSNSWVICQSDDETYVKNASRYGYEHKFLYDWYRDEYEATKFHGNGIDHPLIPGRGR